MVYHLFNPNMKNVRQMIRELGVPVTLTTRTDFENVLKEYSSGMVGVDVGISMLTTQYSRFAACPIRIAPVCEATVAELETLGFTWDVPDIRKLLDAFKE